MGYPRGMKIAVGASSTNDLGLRETKVVVMGITSGPLPLTVRLDRVDRECGDAVRVVGVTASAVAPFGDAKRYFIRFVRAGNKVVVAEKWLESGVGGRNIPVPASVFWSATKVIQPIFRDVRPMARRKATK